MAFDSEIRDSVDSYARDDLNGSLDDHVEFFSFLADDPGLMRRVGEEYFSARYLYKLWEGLRLGEDWARRAQVQLQVQQYASIYEACLHHLLFEQCSETPDVQALLKLRTLKAWDVASSLQVQLSNAPAPDGRSVVAAIESSISLDETKVRFESKADTAVKLGIIDEQLAAELKDFYAARNMIHIHAEIRRGEDWSWELQFARDAYRRLQVFKHQVLQWQRRRTSGLSARVP